MSPILGEKGRMESLLCTVPTGVLENSVLDNTIVGVLYFKCLSREFDIFSQHLSFWDLSSPKEISKGHGFYLTHWLTNDMGHYPTLSLLSQEKLSLGTE